MSLVLAVCDPRRGKRCARDHAFVARELLAVDPVLPVHRRLRRYEAYLLTP